MGIDLKTKEFLKGWTMKKEKFMFNENISVDEYHQKQAKIFRHEFEEELLRQTNTEDAFSGELKHLQKMAFMGKLSPLHKQVLEEWKELYPKRFEKFCHQMDEENRHKLYHFLHLDEEDDK